MLIVTTTDWNGREIASIHKTVRRPMRFAMSLGMLLGMTHGWIVSEMPAFAQQDWADVVDTVKSDTDFSPFGSGHPDLFAY